MASLFLLGMLRRCLLCCCQPIVNQKGERKKCLRLFRSTLMLSFHFHIKLVFLNPLQFPFRPMRKKKNVRAARCTIHRVAQINNRRAIIVSIMAKQHWDRNLLFPNENYAFLFLLLNVLKKWVLDKHQIVFNLVHK
jgi:hypothetical protein